MKCTSYNSRRAEFSDSVHMRESLYHYILNQTEYATLKEEDKQIISGGLKRILCSAIGVLTNVPSYVPKVCQDYSLM